MKKTKFIISFFILFIGFVIIGEIYMFFLDRFTTTEFPTTTMHVSVLNQDEDMVSDIIKSAEKNNVEVFAYKRNAPNMFVGEFTIYGTLGVENYIAEKYNIYNNDIFNSLFLGSRQFIFKDFKDIGNTENISTYSLIGNDEDLYNFKMELIDTYGGNHPRYTDIGGEWDYIIPIWILMGIIILLISFYDIVRQKKENLIRISMGESIGSIIAKNILCDIAGYVLVFTAAIIGLSKFTNSLFQFKISLICFIAILLLNAMLYTTFYFYNIKEVFSNVKISRKVLSFNYVLKLITIVLTIAIVSSNVGVINEAIKLYKQKPFFEEHKDYYYTNIAYLFGEIENKPNVESIFYKRYFKDFNGIYLFNDGLINNENGFYANKNAFNYLSKEIIELGLINLDKDVYFLLPKKKYGKADNTELIESLKSSIIFNATIHSNEESREFEFTYDTVYYEDDVEVIKIEEYHLFGSELLKNPIIVYSNVMPGDRGDFISPNLQANSARSVMYKLDHNIFDNFVREFELGEHLHGKTNVWEKYQRHWNTNKMLLYMTLIFSFLVIFLEIMIISIILKLEYEVNAIELSIKKVLGYSNFQKNRKIILISLISTILSIIAGFVLSSILGISEVYYLAGGGLLVLTLEMIITLFYINKTEKGKIQQILKGGNL